MIRAFKLALASLVTVALLAPPAFAETTAQGPTPSPIVAMGISAVALNASAATRTTSVINVDGYSKLRLKVALTRVAATDLSLTCEESDNGTTGWSYITANAGSTNQLAVYPTTATITISWRVDVNGSKFVRCTISGTAGGGTDLITVTGSKYRGN